MNTEFTSVPSTETIQAITRKEKMSNLINELIDACQVQDILEKLKEIKTMKTLKEQKSAMSLLSNQSLVATKKMDSSISNDGELCFDSTSEIDVDDTEETSEIVRPKPIRTKETKPTFMQSIEPYIIYTTNLKKIINTEQCDKKHAKASGVHINYTHDVACVDFDVPKGLSEEVASEIRKPILKALKKLPGIVRVKTCSGGIHVWCKWNKYPIRTKNNQEVGAFSFYIGDYKISVDLFAPLLPEMKRHVMLPGSKSYLKDKDGNWTKNIGTYELIEGDSMDTVLETDMATVIEAIEDFVDVEWKKVKEEKEEKEIKITPEKSSEKKVDPLNLGVNYDQEYQREFTVTPEVLQLMIDGIEGLIVHGYTESNAETEVSLMILFQSLNCIEDETLRNKAYEIAMDHCTGTAESKFAKVKKENKDKKSSLWWLYRMLQVHNTDYYQEKILPLQRSFQLQKIDFSDDFSIEEFKMNAKSGVYKSRCHAATDLSRLYRYCSKGKGYFFEKYYECHLKIHSFCTPYANDVIPKLQKIKLFEETITNKRTGKEKDVIVTAYDAFLAYDAEMSISGTCFSKIRKGCMTIWNGWKYKKLNKYDPKDKKTQDWMKLVKEVICGGDDELTDYVHKWIANILQNPGVRNRVALILCGIHRAGKGTFTDILCDLTAGFSHPNINNLKDIVGNFNKCIENKVIVVGNEIQTDDGKPAKVCGAVKSYISDEFIQTGEKFEAKRIVENVLNLILSTNSYRSIGIESTDPRYLCLDVDGKFRRSNFLRGLHNNDDYFYRNLMSYYLDEVDLTDWESEEKPVTHRERTMKESSYKRAERFIVDNFEKFVNAKQAMTEEDAKRKFDQLALANHEYKTITWQTFRADLLGLCYYQKGRLYGKDHDKLQLKPEYVDAYLPESYKGPFNKKIYGDQFDYLMEKQTPVDEKAAKEARKQELLEKLKKIQEELASLE